MENPLNNVTSIPKENEFVVEEKVVFVDFLMKKELVEKDISNHSEWVAYQIQSPK